VDPGPGGYCTDEAAGAEDAEGTGLAAHDVNELTVAITLDRSK